MRTKISLSLLLGLSAALSAGAAAPELLVPEHIPAGRPGLGELTAGLRSKTGELGLNGLPGPAGGRVSRALLLLPQDRARPGVLSFQIEAGPRAGLYQCEALGRGLTGTEPVPGWRTGLIGGVTVHYAPADVPGGATVPGVYDLRNISPVGYDIVFLNKPGKDLLARMASPEKKSVNEKRYFSAVWSHWYPEGSAALPVDMIWAGDSQAGTQGAGTPVFERPSPAVSGTDIAMRARQQAGAPAYYRGPYGRHGFALHTDRWEEPARLADPAYAGRPEGADFRWRDTNGCVKLRPACLELLNEFIAGQEAAERRVQLEVRETPLLDGLPDTR